jgi:RNAse (barnase) inhibitor barstar
MSRNSGAEFEFFVVRPPSDEFQGAAIATIGMAVEGKHDLLRSLAQQLAFPSYFGHNWDALEESLQDLLPNQGREVVLVHETVPEQMTTEDLKSYLRVLQRVMKHRTSEHEPTLRVLFHEKERARIKAVEAG